MFDRDELKEIRDRASGVREGVQSGSVPQRFAVAMVGAVVFLAFVVGLIYSTGMVPAVGIGAVGGFTVDIPTLIGENMRLYPAAAESSACRKTFEGNTPRRGDEYLGALGADIANARSPATDSPVVTKDIKVPDALPGVDVVRIQLNRFFTPSSPDYPPSSSPLGYALSNGRDPDIYLDRIQWSGLDSGFSGDDDGYADRTNFRTRESLVSGGNAKNFTVRAHGEYDFSPADRGRYPVSNGTDDRIYLDGIALNGLDSRGNGQNDGYEDFTQQNTDNITRTTTPTLTVDSVGADPLFDDANASRYPDGTGFDGQVYVSDVDYSTIANPTGDNGGYADFTAQHTDPQVRGSATGITVAANRRTYTYGDQDATVYPQPSDGSSTDGGCGWFNDCVHYITGVDFAGINDDDPAGFYDDYTGMNTNLLRPGDSYTLTDDVEYQADNCDDYHFLTSWIDFDQDGQLADNEYPIKTITDCGLTSTSFSTDISVPLTAAPGTTMLRTMIKEVCPASGDCSSDLPEPDDSGYNGEMYDYTVHVGEPSFVYAFVDWNHDGQFTADEGQELGQFMDRSSTSFSVSDSITPPTDAVSGSTLLRVVHRQSELPPTGGSDFRGESEDYTIEIADNVTHNVRAWVDWNDDGTLNDTLASNGGEAYDLGEAKDQTGTFTLSESMTIPNGAPDGSHLLRVTHKQSRGDPVPGQDFFYGETEDYTLHLNASDSHIRAWVDLNNDSTLGNAGGDELVLDATVSPLQNDGAFDVKREVAIPGGYANGKRLMRVTHKQGLNPPQPDEGTDWFGETEDFTVIINDTTDQPDYDENITLGEASMAFTDMKTSNLETRGGVFMDENFADNTVEDPVFGRDGEFVLQANQVTITNLVGRAHFFGFKILRFPFTQINMTYNPPDPQVKSDNTCVT